MFIHDKRFIVGKLRLTGNMADVAIGNYGGTSGSVPMKTLRELDGKTVIARIWTSCELYYDTGEFGMQSFSLIDVKPLSEYNPNFEYDLMIDSVHWDCDGGDK